MIGTLKTLKLSLKISLILTELLKIENLEIKFYKFNSIKMCFVCMCNKDTDYSAVTSLFCCSEVKAIPKEFVWLKVLRCAGTQITEVPKELTRLIILDCSSTKIKEIPKELTQLNYLYLYNTPITEIPKELGLIELNAWNCPNLVKIPEIFKERYKQDYNFIRVPVVFRLKFNNLKRIYSENIRLQLEIKFNEVYYAPSGKGALELFEKYKI